MSVVERSPGAELYGGNPSCPSPTTSSPVNSTSTTTSTTTTSSIQTTNSMHPQQATVDYQTGAMSAPVPMSFQVMLLSTFLITSHTHTNVRKIEENRYSESFPYFIGIVNLEKVSSQTFPFTLIKLCIMINYSIVGQRKG